MCAAVTSAALGVGMGTYQILQGEKNKKKAKAAMNQYERADLDNAYENMQISTVGSDMIRDEMLRSSASLVSNLQQGDSRTLAAGLPRIQSEITKSSNEARNYLDQQIRQREQLIARDNVNIRGVKENRDLQNLQAISSQYNTGKQDSFNGMLGVLRGAGALANNLGTTGNTTAQGNTTDNNVVFGDTVVTKNNEYYAPPQTVNYPVAPGFNSPNPWMSYDPFANSKGNEFITQNIFDNA